MRVAAALIASVLSVPPAVAARKNEGARFEQFEYAGWEPPPAARAGEYHNPVLGGFYPDPCIVRVGDDYYLTNSTFAYFPGIPIFHSRDLVNWTQIGNAIDRPQQFNFNGLAVSEGMFAPSLTEHSGTWYIVNVCVGCGGSFVITAKHPAGPWSQPRFIHGLDGAIDPSLFFDDDGSAWIVYNGLPPGKPLYDGHRAIWLQRFDPLSAQTDGDRILLVNAGIHPKEKPVWIEGPHIIKKDGFYYLVAAEGGTGENHSEVVLRSRALTGRYVPGPVNPILTQRDLPKGRASPITSSGHASFVTSANGRWWAVFLATRPYSDDYYNTGRETFLLPVSWRDGWPDILPQGEVIPAIERRPDLPWGRIARVPTSGSFKVVDSFTERQLPGYWMMLRTPSTGWYSLDHGSLLLRPRAVSIGSRGNPSFLARRQQHANNATSAVIRFSPAHEGERAGLVALQSNEYWFFMGLERRRGRLAVTLDKREGREDPQDGREVASLPFTAAAGSPLHLKIVARGGSYDFYYGYSAGHWHPLKLGQDGTILSTKRAGGFVGAMLGVYAYDPTAKEHE